MSRLLQFLDGPARSDVVGFEGRSAWWAGYGPKNVAVTF